MAFVSASGQGPPPSLDPAQGAYFDGRQWQPGYPTNTVTPPSGRSSFASPPFQGPAPYYLATPDRPDFMANETAPFLSEKPGKKAKHWMPAPFRTWYYIPFIFVTLAGAIGLEVLLIVSNKNNGWASGNTDRQQTILHYAYTIPPVIIASVLVTLWNWTDAEIKKLQPYVDMLHGDSPAQRSVLLDYTRYSHIAALPRAAFNRHYVVAAASFVAILTLVFQPLASAVLVVKEIWWTGDIVTSRTLAAAGLALNLTTNDLSTFVAASGYAGSSIAYRVDPPPFVRPPYVVARFVLPAGITTNGTVVANTTAVKLDPNCVQVTVDATQSGTTLVNSISQDTCSFNWTITAMNQTLFGSDAVTCSPAMPVEFSPVVFWMYSPVPSPTTLAAYCSPALSLWDVTAAVDITSGNVTSVVERNPFSTSSNFSSFAGNITGAPLFGRAFNSLVFDLPSTDAVRIARESAIQLQLPSSLLWVLDMQDISIQDTNFGQTGFISLMNAVYGAYLALVGRDAYFLPDSEPLDVQPRFFRSRVFVSPLATHLLAASLFVLGLCTLAIQLVHRKDIADLQLKDEPGTIASAVSLGAQTGLGHVLANRENKDDLQEALKDKKFSIDPTNRRIVMEGEPGYDHVVHTARKRQSVFGM